MFDRGTHISVELMNTPFAYKSRDILSFERIFNVIDFFNGLRDRFGGSFSLLHDLLYALANGNVVGFITNSLTDIFGFDNSYTLRDRLDDIYNELTSISGGGRYESFDISSDVYGQLNSGDTLYIYMLSSDDKVYVYNESTGSTSSFDLDVYKIIMLNEVSFKIVGSGILNPVTVKLYKYIINSSGSYSFKPYVIYESLNFFDREAFVYTPIRMELFRNGFQVSFRNLGSSPIDYGIHVIYRNIHD